MPNSPSAPRDSDTDLVLTKALLPRWRRTAGAGHADDDLAAVYAGAETP